MGGFDLAVEASVPTRSGSALEVVRAGGRVAKVGPGSSVDLRLEKLSIHNVALSMELVNTNTTPMLLKLVESGRLGDEQFVSRPAQAP